MSDNTNISWTDHTFNPWWGCSRIAPGCDNCYAAAFDKRCGGDHWDSKNQPRLTGDANWLKPIKWNNQAKRSGKRSKVFCGSMMDWCDKNAPVGALDKLWDLIRSTPWLDWQLLTKRATRIKKCLPHDWVDGYDNVWLGVTVENIKHGLPRVTELAKVPAKIKFLSCEPLLEDLRFMKLDGIHWVIIGGESGSNCRKMDQLWVRNLIDDCCLYGTPVWFKQWGGNKRDKGGCLIDGREVKQWPL